MLFFLDVVMVAGFLRKMRIESSVPLTYSLAFSDNSLVPLSSYLGKRVRLHFSGAAQCVSCSRDIKKTFNQGYCYPCFTSLAACDTCIVKPELCHFSQGTCREPNWGLSFCMQPHIVYLANSSGLKVGITRQTQIPVRWFDQGAVQALPLYELPSRYASGLCEVVIKKHLADKTNWRAMLQGDQKMVDLHAFWTDFELQYAIEQSFSQNPILHGQYRQLYKDNNAVEIHYPVSSYEGKIKTINIEKSPSYEGVLRGVKGQYLLFHDAVINVRKYTGYHCVIELLP